ncbi:MAG: Gfo/Idh/MocA family oxidoreductase [Rhizobiaceae bacterium]
MPRASLTSPHSSSPSPHSPHSSTLNVAFIGLGMVAETHLKAVADLSDVLSLRGIYARNTQTCRVFAEAAKELTGRSPVTYGSIAEIAADDAVDFTVILTPPNARSEIIKPLAAAGKHILMEKPVERNCQAAAAIVDMCEQAKVLNGVVFQHRVREASVKLRQMIESEELGSFCLAEVNVPWWRDQSYYDEPGRGTYTRDGGGVLISQAIHTLDLLLSLVGDVTEVQAMARTTTLHDLESEDFVSSGLDFANGGCGSLVASTASYPGDAESITLHFDKASAHLKSGVLTINWQDGRNETFGADAKTGGGANPMAFTHAWHRDVIADFCSAITDGHAPLVSGREALKVHRLIDALIQSSNNKKAVTVANQE